MHVDFVVKIPFGNVHRKNSTYKITNKIPKQQNIYYQGYFEEKKGR